MDYGVSDGDAFAVGLICGGRIRVLVAARAMREPLAYVVDLGGEGRQVVRAETYREKFRLDRSGIEPDGQTFVAIQNPSVRMVFVGAVHIAQPLVRKARDCGYQPIVVDPREGFATAARFPDTQIFHEWPDVALGAIGLDARTCMVTLSHDPKLDDPAQMAALRSDVFYIGALGSARSHAARVARLAEAGFDTVDTARICGPVGIKLGGRHPAEIAVSVMAQITLTLRGK